MRAEVRVKRPDEEKRPNRTNDRNPAALYVRFDFGDPGDRCSGRPAG
jgi:hypothetical protein